MRSAFTLLAAISLALSAFGQAQVSMPPSACEQTNLLVYGRPVFAPGGKDLAFGISFGQHNYKTGNPIKLHIWVENGSDAPVSVWTCGDLGRFEARGIEVFSRDGNRILSRHELEFQQKCATDPRLAEMWNLQKCLRNFQVYIPAHSCVTRDVGDFTDDLTRLYDLPPGKYVLRLRKDWRSAIDVCAPQKENSFHGRSGDLKFTVANP